jgi:hypothetical protein
MTLSSEEKSVVIAVWSEVIGVQKHFNEIEMRIRGIFVTTLLAFFAAMGFIIDKELHFIIGGTKIQYAVVVPYIGIFTTWLFYFMDRYWYHRLLAGSVKHAMEIEALHSKNIPELNLSSWISKLSPYKPGVLLWPAAWLLVRDPKWTEKRELHSDGKIELFYKSVMLFLLLVSIVIGTTGGVVKQHATHLVTASKVHYSAQHSTDGTVTTTQFHREQKPESKSSQSP